MAGFRIVERLKRRYAEDQNMPEAKSTVLDRLSPLELARIAPLSEASRLSSLSEDTILRNHRDKLLQLSPRRLGMRVRDALMLTSD